MGIMEHNAIRYDSGSALNRYTLLPNECSFFAHGGDYDFRNLNIYSNDTSILERLPYEVNGKSSAHVIAHSQAIADIPTKISYRFLPKKSPPQHPTATW